MRVGEPVGVGVGERDCEPVLEAVAVARPMGEAPKEGLCEGVAVEERDSGGTATGGVVEGEVLGLLDPPIEGVPLRESSSPMEREGVGVGDVEGVAESVAVGVGLEEGVGVLGPVVVGVGVGELLVVALGVGEEVPLGVRVGETVGVGEGEGVAVSVLVSLGELLGCEDPVTLWDPWEVGEGGSETLGKAVPEELMVPPPAPPPEEPLSKALVDARREFRAKVVALGLRDILSEALPDGVWEV